MLEFSTEEPQFGGPIDDPLRGYRQQTDTGVLNIEGNEEISLHGDNLDSFAALWQDDRWWVRLPARNQNAIISILSITWCLIILPIWILFPTRLGRNTYYPPLNNHTTGGENRIYAAGD